MKHSCLENLIGIKTDCETIEGASGLYVNQIPGIDIRTANGIKNEDYTTGLAFVQAMLNTAADIVGDEIIRSLRGNYKFNAILNEGAYCFFETGYKPVYNGYRGVRIERRYFDNYTSMFVPTVRMLVEEDSTITIRITDSFGKVTLFSDVVLKAKTVTDVQLDYESKADWIDIDTDNTALKVAKTSATAGCGGCGTRTTSYYDDYIMTKGLADGIPVGNDTFGILPTVQIRCSEERLVCSIKSYLDTCILYKFAGLFFNEASITKRNNRYTIYTREDSKTFSQHYDNDVQVVGISSPLGLYQLEVQKILEALTTFYASTNEMCFDCKKNNYGFIMP